MPAFLSVHFKFHRNGCKVPAGKKIENVANPGFSSSLSYLELQCSSSYKRLGRLALASEFNEWEPFFVFLEITSTR